MSGARALAAPQVLTFGCRLNAFESAVIRDHLAAVDDGATIVVNTCAVTAEAERQARQAIRRARRENPGARIVVTGCAAQIDPARYAAMPEVDRVIGNAEKMRAETWTAGGPRVVVGDRAALRETASHLVAGFADRARAFVEVQQGCDHRCTFCIIPYGRGDSRSAPLGRVVEQVRRLVAGGTQEVVLTGVDLTAWGGDLPGRPRFGALVRRLLAQVPELPRLRLSSLDPVEIDDDLVALFAEEPRLMPHAHLSLQAGDDLILKRMKRRHLRADAIAVAERLRRARPDVALGADLIAGFPTEDAAAFANTLALVEACGLTHLHVFPYSARGGTPAARMPQVPVAARRERAARLREAGEAALARFLAGRVGAAASVLVERDGVGRSEHFVDVAVRGGATAGAIVPVRIAAVAGARLVGDPLETRHAA